MILMIKDIEKTYPDMVEDPEHVKGLLTLFSLYTYVFL